MITQSLKIRCTGGSSSSKLHQFRKMGSIMKRYEGVTINIGTIVVLFVGSHESHATWTFWLGRIYHYYNTATYFEWVWRGCNDHQSSVGVSFIGLCEPHTTLALWLGWKQFYDGTWTLTMITQSSKIRCTGGSSSSKLHQFRRMTSIMKRYEGVTINISTIMVLFVGLHEPHATWAFWLGWLHHYYNM